MGSLHLVDPSHRDLVAAFPLLAADGSNLSSVRHELAEGFARMVGGGPVQRDERTIAGSGAAPDVRVLLYRPGAAVGPMPAILYIHGGGFVAGTPDMVDGASQKLANESGALVVAVDYRLAPETAFPGPIEDCYAALAWLASEAEALGVDPARVAVVGDSAGGGLAAALALLARDRRGPPLKAQLLFYPMLDARTGTADAPVDNPMTGEFVWTREANRFGWTSMRGGQRIPDDRVGHFSPALGTDLTGLPPTVLIVGSLDLFLEEDVAFALRLIRAGVPVDVGIYHGAVHGFDRLPEALGERATTEMQAAISRLL